ncbi:oxidoreductase [Actinospica durhamensis]|uniref:Oxidoreductase n=1 Tax=Actinospica durhamensis TaxID=1508375 RepID=A0A941IUI5_9ACTN|nr:PDR/VanB family oxidoreductase [Actinospica durhamensis]MBR7835601.1 oxidoreductase [Actinospica durhamensis]
MAFADATVRVESKQVVADGVVALTLTRPDGGRLADWTPGAHIDLILPADGRRADGLGHSATRQYSLCGDRWDPARYRVAVLREPDGRGGSAYVHDVLEPGDLVGVGAPRDNFPLVPSERYLFLAGGIGITPLLPMIHQAALLGADWHLWYAGRSLAAMAFAGELADAHGDRVHLAPGDRAARIDLTALLAQPQPGTKIYCCGPTRLLDAVTRATAHWPAHTLRTERFAAAPPLPARATAFEVHLRRTGARVTVDPGVSVLDALRAAGVEVLSSCRQGVCGTCLTAVVEGRPDHRDALLADHERAAGDRMLVCVSRSCDDRLVLDL